MPKTQNDSIRKILFNVFKIILIVVILYFVYNQLSKNWSEVIAYEWSVNYWLLFVSIMLHLVTFTIFSYVWCILIKSFGFTVKLRHAFKIGYITNLGRYIPGKIWPVMGMSYLAKQLDINEENSVISWIVALIFTLPSAFMASFVCILITPEIFEQSLNNFLDWTMYLSAIIIFIGSLLLIIIPNKIFLIINKILIKLNRPIIKLKIDFKTALLVYIGYFICWLLYGFAFWVFLISITSNFNIPMVASIGGFIIAYQIGYLAFFAPGGIGVRELILATVLMPYLGPISAGIAVAARIWNMVVEIIAATISFAIKFPIKKK